MHLAVFNIGILQNDWEDPHVLDFLRNLERVYGIAEGSPGYVWHFLGGEMEISHLDAEGVLGGNPRTALTLSVRGSPQSLESFAFNAQHKRFYDRKLGLYVGAEQVWGGHRLMMWRVSKGQIPTINEAVSRLRHLTEHGDSNVAFGWAHFKDAQHCKRKNCDVVAG